MITKYPNLLEGGLTDKDTFKQQYKMLNNIDQSDMIPGIISHIFKSCIWYMIGNSGGTGKEANYEKDIKDGLEEINKYKSKHFPKPSYLENLSCCYPIAFYFLKGDRFHIERLLKKEQRLEKGETITEERAQQIQKISIEVFDYIREATEPELWNVGLTPSEIKIARANRTFDSVYSSTSEREDTGSSDSSGTKRKRVTDPNSEEGTSDAKFRRTVGWAEDMQDRNRGAHI